MQNRLLIIKSAVDKKERFKLYMQRFVTFLPCPVVSNGFLLINAHGWNKNEFFEGTKTVKNCKHTASETLSSGPHMIDKCLFLKFNVIYICITLLA
jgi:hypothetical protein